MFITGAFNAQDEDQDRSEKALQDQSERPHQTLQAYKRHILTKKDTKTKRQLRGMTECTTLTRPWFAP
jgi:hypothetical protein